jgi:hypothetical protein
MNSRLAQFLTFRNKHQHWYEKPFNGKNSASLWSALGGVGLGVGLAGLGAGLMYIFDPDRGRYRRAMARHKVTDAMNRTGENISRTSHELKERARGVISDKGSFFHRNSDDTGHELM